MFVNSGKYAIQTPVSVDQPGRRLFPHPGNTGQVVGLVTSEGGIFHVVGGVDPRSVADSRLVVEHVFGDPPLVVENADVGILDQLVGIAVTGNDQYVPAAVPGHRGQGSDHVICLEAFGVDRLQAQSHNQFPHQVQLLVEDVGLPLSVRLVAGQLLVAKRRARKVECHRHASRVVVSQKCGQHRREAEDRVRDLTGRGGHVRRKGEERPVGQGVAVD